MPGFHSLLKVALLLLAAPISVCLGLDAKAASGHDAAADIERIEQKGLPSLRLAGISGARIGDRTSAAGIELAHCCHAHRYAPFDRYCCHGPSSRVVVRRGYVGPASVRGSARRTARRTSRRVGRRR